MQTFDGLPERYHRIEQEKQAATATSMTVIDGLKAQIDALSNRIQAAMPDLDDTRRPFETEQAQLMEKIKPLAIAMLADAKTKTYPFSGGTIKFCSGYMRYNWDTKGLMGYSRVHPEVMDLCEQVPVHPLVTIELN